MKTAYISILAVLLFSLLSCGSSDGNESRPYSSGSGSGHGSGNSGEDDIVNGNGVVQFVDVEGGCWRIVGDNGIHYEPINLSDEFRKDGLAVQFEVKFRRDLATVCMVGVIVEIVSIHQ